MKCAFLVSDDTVLDTYFKSANNKINTYCEIV